MRKIMAGILTIMLVAGLALPVFAAKGALKKQGEPRKYERIVAEVLSLDVPKRIIVVKREENGETRTITVSEKAISQLEVGQRIRIKLKAGTNESAGVRILGNKIEAGSVAEGASVPAEDLAVPAGQ